MQIESFSQPTQALFQQVQEQLPQPIKIDVKQQKSGQLLAQNSHRYFNDQAQLIIAVDDATVVEYSVAHELLQMLSLFSGFSQVFGLLTTQEVQVDTQVQAIGMTLHTAVSHLIVYSELRKHDLIDFEVRQAYIEGLRHELIPQAQDVQEGQLIYQILMLLDALVFFEGGNAQLQKQWQNDYPKAYEQAKILYIVMTEKNIDDPASFRQTVVDTWLAFDHVLSNCQLPELNLNQLMTLSPVLTQSQLQQPVHEVYDILHSDKFQAVATKENAYVGIDKANQQNTFVLDIKEAQLSPAVFKAIYQDSVATLFEKLQQPYSVAEEEV